MCSYFMETIKQFENLTQLNKFEKVDTTQLVMNGETKLQRQLLIMEKP